MVNSEDIIILKMVEEVRLQCEFAMIAYTDIVQMLKGEYLLEAEKSFSEALERRNQITQDANYLPEDLDQALDAVKQALKNKTDIMDRANVRLFYSIHALVTATANISKTFLDWLFERYLGRSKKSYSPILSESPVDRDISSDYTSQRE